MTEALKLKMFPVLVSHEDNLKSALYYETILKPVFHNFIKTLVEMKDPTKIVELRTGFIAMNSIISENVGKIVEKHLPNLKMVWLHDIHLLYVPF